MAAQEPPQGEPSSPPEPVPPDRLPGVGRAGRQEATRRRKRRRDPGLIERDEPCRCSPGNAAHLSRSLLPPAGTPAAAARKASATARRSVAPVRALRSRVTTMTRSVPGGKTLRCRRKCSRSDRLMRFRTTAVPARRPTFKPKRTPPRCPAEATCRTNGPELRRRPAVSARRNSTAPRTRAARGKRACPRSLGVRLSGAAALWPAAASARSARRECSSALGTRACVSACSDLADRSASFHSRRREPPPPARQRVTLAAACRRVKRKGRRLGKNPFASPPALVLFYPINVVARSA